ncbi:MAG: acyl-homoserine-lactone synthase [Sphingomicrobium sp.]
MVIVEQGISDVRERSLLRSMFEARKHVFVDLLKWDVPVLDGRFEVDQFDDRDAYYIIVADEDDRHLGSARLLRTDRPHILGTLFPELCNGDAPGGPDILEITRFCLSRNQNAADRRRTRDRLVSALVRFALDRNIRTFTGVAEMNWLQQILAFGWDCRPLGPPRLLDCGMIGALAITIGPGTPALLAGNGIWEDEELTAIHWPEAA